MKKSTILAMLFFLAGFYSCETESVEEKTENNSLNISDKVLSKLESLYMNTSDIEVGTFETIDGETLEVYTIEGDILFTEEDLMSMHDETSKTAKQFRTRNLVTRRNTIRVLGYVNNDIFGLSQTAQRGLRYAVDNYNVLNLNIRMELTFGSNTSSKDIIVYVNDNINPRSSASGLAGFPSNGFPYRYAMLNNYANNNQNDQQLEHLIGHEIGHCIGMRHTDWNTRFTCGENSNEGQGSIGAIYIPGTAQASSDPNSLMNSCYPNNTNGEFSFFDRVALEYIY